MNSLFTFGCSLTDEFGEEYINYKKDKLPDTWPKILSKLLSKDLINLGKAASSNYSIFRQFISVSEKIDKNDILIFGWTSILRYSFNDIHNNLVDILPNHKNHFPSLKTHEEILLNRDSVVWVYEILDYIKFINLFCEKINCRVYHWTSDNEITKFVYKNNPELIQKLNFISVDELKCNSMFSANMFDYFCNPKHYDGNNVAKIVDETNNLINDRHLGEFGHKAQSKLFYEYIISQKTK
jgi:hypothetical protein